MQKVEKKEFASFLINNDLLMLRSKCFVSNRVQTWLEVFKDNFLV